MNTTKWLKRLKNVECPNTTWIHDQGSFPLVIKRAKALYVYDVDGKRYLDFTAFFGVAALGHGSVATRQALAKQSRCLIHGMGDVHPSPSRIQLMETLARLSPFSQTKVLLGLSGADAVEMAMKTAILKTQRPGFIALSGGYHGLHLGALTLNNRSVFREGLESWLHSQNVSVLPFPLGAPSVFAEDDTAAEDSVLNTLQEHLKTKQYAGFVCEVIQGRGGVRSLSKRFLQQASDLCAQYGTLTIADEIWTGLGRTGSHLWACQKMDWTPDILCCGKALGGGLPLSACVSPWLEVWGPATGEARHTQTFLGHPLACATGYHTLRVLEKDMPQFRTQAVAIEAWLNTHAAEYFSQPIELRGCGFMQGVAFEANKNPGLGVAYMQSALKAGLLLLPEGSQAHVLSFSPPLIARLKDYQRAFGILKTL